MDLKKHKHFQHENDEWSAITGNKNGLKWFGLLCLAE